MFQASLSYEARLTRRLSSVITRNMKAAGKKYAIGFINAYDEDGARDLAQRMAKVIPGTLTSTGMDTSFAQINIFHDDISITYLVPSNAAANEVIKAAFGGKATYGRIRKNETNSSLSG